MARALARGIHAEEGEEAFPTDFFLASVLGFSPLGGQGGSLSQWVIPCGLSVASLSPPLLFLIVSEATISYPIFVTSYNDKNGCRKKSQSKLNPLQVWFFFFSVIVRNQKIFTRTKDCQYHEKQQ